MASATPKPFYIGLSGGLGVGKTTLARLMAFNLRDYKCRLAAFGNSLKSFVSTTYNIPVGLLHQEAGKNSLPNWVPAKVPLKPEQVPPVTRCIESLRINKSQIDFTAMDIDIVMECISCPVGGLTCGRLLQIVGEAFRTHASPDFWVTQLERFLETAKTDGGMDIVIVEDVRYENEAKWIASKGGVIVKITGDPPTTSCIAKRDLHHPSELGFSSLCLPILTEVSLGTRTDGEFYKAAQEIAEKVVIKMNQ